MSDSTPEYVMVPREKLLEWKHRARSLARDGHHCDATTFCDSIWQATSAMLAAPKSAPVACHRTLTGKPGDEAKWSWIHGPASLGAIDQARLYGWRIESAYLLPR
jgi:hypothetical protein